MTAQRNHQPRPDREMPAAGRKQTPELVARFDYAIVVSALLAYHLTNRPKPKDADATRLFKDLNEAVAALPPDHDGFRAATVVACEDMFKAGEPMLARWQLSALLVPHLRRERDEYEADLDGPEPSSTPVPRPTGPHRGGAKAAMRIPAAHPTTPITRYSQH